MSSGVVGTMPDRSIPRSITGIMPNSKLPRAERVSDNGISLPSSLLLLLPYRGSYATPWGILSRLAASPSPAQSLVDLLETVVVVASAICNSVPSPAREDIVGSGATQVIVDGEQRGPGA